MPAPTRNPAGEATSLLSDVPPVTAAAADDDDSDDDDECIDEPYPINLEEAQDTVRRFIIFSFLFTACPACALACLALATARLGKIGAWSSGMLYLTYTLSSITGATFIVKQLGGRNGCILGMSLYCVYVACFWVAATYPGIAAPAALSGGFVGGIGSGITWTAQGSYFTQAAEEHALLQGCEWGECTAALSGIFAFAYLLEETILHISSYFLLQWGVKWTTIFFIYAVIAVLSTVSMIFVKNYPITRRRGCEEDNMDEIRKHNSPWYKITVALNLLLSDKKMRYMIGVNAVFGFAGAFLNSFVSGEVIRAALNDTNSKTVGLFVSWTAGFAAFMSLMFGKFTHDYGKAPVMVLGITMFIFVALPFIIKTDLESWTWYLLLLVYSCHAIGRAMFESTMKATFADFFPYEKEGAFANIILQNGLFGSIGYILTFELRCANPGRYCVEYTNGTLHDVFTFELLVCITGVLAIFGYLKALSIYREERSGAVADSELRRYKKEAIKEYRRSHVQMTIAPFLPENGKGNGDAYQAMD